MLTLHIEPDQILWKHRSKAEPRKNKDKMIVHTVHSNNHIRKIKPKGNPHFN